VAAALYTIGYEGRSVGEVLDALVRANVQRLVDVRELPLSRRRGFSKTRFGETLADVGIEYVHAKPLGNPKDNRDRYRAGNVEGGVKIYRRHLQNGSREALLDLATSVNGTVTCLLCFERDHQLCHRAVITESLADLLPSVTISHL
jgi:uncharacterized protein (DUF488 family)